MIFIYIVLAWILFQLHAPAWVYILFIIAKDGEVIWERQSTLTCLTQSPYKRL